MRARWLMTIVAILVCLNLAACADSWHQVQRGDLAAAGGPVIVDDSSYAVPYYGYPGYWGVPFGAYSGFYGLGYGYYGAPYPYGYGRGRSWAPRSFNRPAPFAGAPRQFFRRR